MHYSHLKVYDKDLRFKRRVQNEEQTKSRYKAGPSHTNSDMIPVEPEDLDSSDSSSTEDFIPGSLKKKATVETVKVGPLLLEPQNAFSCQIEQLHQ